MKGKLAFALGAVALVAAAFIAGWPAPDAAQPARVAQAPPGPAFVRSFEGTHVDGGAVAGPGDQLVANEDLVELFDYYLSAVGEKPLAQVRAEIERELDRRLRPVAAHAAKQLLGRYLDYKYALVTLEADKTLVGTDAQALRKRLRAMRELRARYFSDAESRAMFGREDAEQQEALARLEIRQDQGLTEDERQARLAALDAALPPEVRAAREAPFKVARLEEAAASLRAGGAGEEEVFRMRAAALDPAAAERLAALDREEAHWRTRIAMYQSERRGLHDAASLAALRNRLFTPAEQRRLPAYEAPQ